MIPQQIIARKRDGDALAPQELTAFLSAYLDGAVGDDQMAAFLMAVHFNGLAGDELDAMVEAMIRSGEVIERGEGWPGPRVDKHSTGGVGDKVSLVLAPLAAEMGMVVPMMSGRGLGHSGGTLDKLESIPGFRTRLALDEFDRVLREVGCAMIGQTREIAPLDRRLYALRDVTATVPSLPLITASIMSKKLVEGLDALVLDVKVGRGAFLSRFEDARALARAMVDVGVARGLAVTAVLSAMDRPLGRAVGNALEVLEAIACLTGGGPAEFRGLCVELAAEMALSGGLVDDVGEGRRRAEAALAGGAPMERFLRLAAAQGGRMDPSRGDYGLPQAPLREAVHAEGAGLVAGIDPLALGYGVLAMGGGRTRQDQEIDPSVGFEVEVAVGQRVAGGEPLAVVHAATTDGLAAGVRAVRSAIRLDGDAGGGADGGGEPDAEPDGGLDGARPPLPLVIETIRAKP